MVSRQSWAGTFDMYEESNLHRQRHYLSREEIPPPQYPPQVQVQAQEMIDQRQEYVARRLIAMTTPTRQIAE
jgi:hypothetical protein